MAVDSEDILDLLKDLEKYQKWNTDLPKHEKEKLIESILAKRFEENRKQTFVGQDVLLSINDTENAESDRADFLVKTPLFSMVKRARDKVYANSEYRICFFINGGNNLDSLYVQHDLVKSLAVLEGANAPNSTCNDILLKLTQGLRVLEVFGSAITESSKEIFIPVFNSYIDIPFEYDSNAARNKIVAAHIETFGLYPERVCDRKGCESNFRIFYLLRQAAKHNERFMEMLGDGENYFYLGENNLDLDGANGDDISSLDELQRVMLELGLVEHEIDSILRTCGIVLQLGNLVYENDEEGNIVVEKNDEEEHEDGEINLVNRNLEQAALLLEVYSDSLEFLLCNQSEDAEDDREELQYVARNKIKDCEMTSDAMAKVLFSRLFQWLTAKVNSLINPRKVKLTNYQSSIQSVRVYENKNNNYGKTQTEQICNQMANQSTVKHFISSGFEKERENEGLNCDHIPHLLIESSNINVAFAIAEVLSLDVVPDGVGFVQLLCSKLNSEINSMIKYDSETESFTYNDTEYDIDRLIGTNENDLTYDIHKFLLDCGNEFICEQLFGDGPESIINEIADWNKGSNYVTQLEGSSYIEKSKIQLSNILESTTSSEPYYIRCICANQSDNDFITWKPLEELRILETICMRNRGYTHKIHIDEWRRRYQVLAPKDANDVKKLLSSIEKIIPPIKNQIFLGKSSVTYRNAEHRLLEDKMTSVLTRSVVICQSVIRRTLVKLTLRKMRILDKDLERGIKDRNYENLKQLVENSKLFKLARGLNYLDIACNMLVVMEKEHELEGRIHEIAELKPEFDADGECTNLSYYKVVVNKMNELLELDHRAFQYEEAQMVLKKFEVLVRSKNVLGQLLVAQRTMDKALLVDAMGDHSIFVEKYSNLLPENFGHDSVIKCQQILDTLESEEAHALTVLDLIIQGQVRTIGETLDISIISVKDFKEMVASLKPNGQGPLTEFGKAVHKLGDAVLQLRRRIILTIESGDDWNAVSNTLKQVRVLVHQYKRNYIKESPEHQRFRDVLHVLGQEMKDIGNKIGLSNEIETVVEIFEEAFISCHDTTEIEKLLKQATYYELDKHKENYVRTLVEKMQERLEFITTAEKRLKNVLESDQIDEDRLCGALEFIEANSVKISKDILQKAKETQEQIKQLKCRVKVVSIELDVAKVKELLEDSKHAHYRNKDLELLSAKMKLPKEELLKKQFIAAVNAKDEKRKSLILTELEDILREKVMSENAERVPIEIGICNENTPSGRRSLNFSSLLRRNSTSAS